MAEEYRHTVKLKNRITKGHHGYIGQQKKRLLVRSLILLSGVAGLVAIGYCVTKTNKNLMSLFAILTAIPMAMQLATYFSIRRFHSRDQAEYERIAAIVSDGVLDSDLVIAKKDGKSIPVNYAVFSEDEVFVFTEDDTLDIDVYTEYLHTFLRISQVDCEISLYNRIESFEKRLKSVSLPSRDEAADVVLQREGVFRAVSI